MKNERTTIVATGHRIDDPDRRTPRFPEASAWRVEKEVDRQLDRWLIGPGDTIICGGASGGDLIVAERAQVRGAHVELELARSQTDFVRSSVAPSGNEWVERFHRVAVEASVREPEHTDGDVYAAANRRMVERARSVDSAHRRAVAVWDGQRGDGSGGTDHMAGLLKSAGFEPYGIDPSPRRSADRQWADGPKKMLALDGGGIRGVFTLGVLSRIEARLRTESGRSDLVLADYFDYVAGTSTGAIIATAISYGMSVEDITGHYRSLADKIFGFNLNRLVARHPTKPLRKALDRIFGYGRTLGDPDLETLLMIVLHNTNTDSPWPLSNCPSAKYNRPERMLAEQPDRNLDLHLNELVRGSTAAPYYFAPQRVMVGSTTVTFQDGGVTPFNNPAMLLATMATQAEYEVAWPTSADDLLLVSVGTGMAPTHGLDGRTLLRLLKLPNVFLTGASISQDLICRAVGRTVAGAPIDREVAGVPYGRDAFRYARYNADFSSSAWLEEALVAGGNREAARNAVALTALGPKKLGKMNSDSHIDELYALGESVGHLFRTEDVVAGFPVT